MKIRTKLNIFYGAFFMLAVALLSLSFYVVIEHNHNNALRETVEHQKNMFFNLEERDIVGLSAVLGAVVHDQNFKKAYLEQDREKLYNSGQQLFQDLKENYGITHWYFILPDGHTFLRMHHKEIYGDLITRHTLWGARDTKQLSSGIELGKTAFALRAVMPYYDDGELIGYVELGEEINHFLDILKETTGDEFTLIADKKHLDEEKWASVKAVAKERNNWGDLDKHVILGQTRDDGATKKCFTEDNLEKIEEGEAIVNTIRIKNKIYICGGFEITDARGEHTGAVISLIDVTNIIKTNYFTVILITAALMVFVLIMNFLVASSISRPIKEIITSIDEISKGKLDIQLGKGNFFEMQRLIDSLNRVLISLKLAVKKVGVAKGELGLGEAIKAKKEAEEKYKLLFESAIDAIFIADPKTKRLVDCNRSAEKLTGYSKEEILSMTADQLHPKDKIKKTMEDFEKQAQGKLMIVETEVLTKNKKRIPVAINSNVMRFENKSYLIGIFRNVSEIKRRTQDLERFIKLAVGREEKMIEMKKKMAQLQRKKYHPSTLKRTLNKEKNK